MPEINEVTLSRIQDAFVQSFEDGLMVTGPDPARPGQVRIESSLSLPKGVVKLLLGDLFDGTVSDRPRRNGRGGDFEVKGPKVAADDSVGDDSWDDGSTFDDTFERPASPDNDGEI